MCSGEMNKGVEKTGNEKNYHSSYIWSKFITMMIQITPHSQTAKNQLCNINFFNAPFITFCGNSNPSLNPS